MQELDNQVIKVIAESYNNQAIVDIIETKE
jgi:hypothetical protein